MNKDYGRTALICFLMTLLAACAGGISKQARSQVTYFGPFDTVQQQPDKYRG